MLFRRKPTFGGGASAATTLPTGDVAVVPATSAAKTFLLSATKLMSATVFAQAFNFALSFYLARIYSPAEFGHYSIFVGIAAVFGAASTGGFDRVVLLARSDGESYRAAVLALLLSGSGAVAVALAGAAIWVFGPVPRLPLSALDVAVFVPAFMASYAAAQVMNYACLRRGGVAAMAGFKVAQSVSAGAIQVLLSASKAVPGLIVGTIAGWSIYIAGTVRELHRRTVSRRPLTARGLRNVARRHVRYPRYVMPNEVVDNLSNQAPLLLIGSFVSLSAAGHYGLALMMLSAPAAVMGQAVGQAFLQYMGRHEANFVALERFMRRIWLGMAVIGIVPFAIVLMFGGDIFRFGFGTHWIGAGVVAQHLAILLFVRFVSSPTSTIYWKLHMQREQWYFSMAAACYRTGCYALPAFGIDLGTAIMLHVAIEVLAISTYNFLALRRLRLLAARTAAPVPT